MAIFRDFSKQKRDRSAGDRNRHKELVREKIRDGIADVIADESIIGKHKGQIIKIPIKGIKEYQFIFTDKRRKGVAEGSGGEEEGQVVKKGKGKGKGDGSGEAGNQEGEDMYETEITIEDAINLMFEDLELPELDRKKYSSIMHESKRKILGYKKRGIRSRLAKRKTLINKLKRKIARRRNTEGESEDSFSFINDDLVYRRTVTKEEEHSNAVVFCIMDTSGSMDQVKKYYARSFYFLLYQFLRTRYQHTEIVFIAHHTSAKEVSEDDFFHKVESGGTYISSGYLKAMEIIEERFSPALWNIYAFHCSDGDNFSSDNEKAIDLAKKLADISNLFGYAEIKPQSSVSWSTMIDRYKKVDAKNFISLKIRDKQEIWPAFKKFLTLDKAENR